VTLTAEDGVLKTITIEDRKVTARVFGERFALHQTQYEMQRHISDDDVTVTHLASGAMLWNGCYSNESMMDLIARFLEITEAQIDAAKLNKKSKEWRKVRTAFNKWFEAWRIVYNWRKRYVVSRGDADAHIGMELF
jgi:hypothetical protein